MEHEPQPQLITAEDVLKRIITDVGDSWNGQGVRWWAELRLREMEPPCVLE